MHKIFAYISDRSLPEVTKGINKAARKDEMKKWKRGLWFNPSFFSSNSSTIGQWLFRYDSNKIGNLILTKWSENMDSIYSYAIYTLKNHY